MDIKIYDRPYFRNVSTKPSRIAHGNGLYAFGEFSIWLGHDMRKCCCCAKLDPKIVEENPPQTLYFVSWRDFPVSFEPFTTPEAAIAYIKKLEENT